MATGGRLGELLVRENLITVQQLQQAQMEQRQKGGRLGQSLTKLGIIDENELTSFLSKQYGVPSINLAEFDIDPEVISLIPQEVADKHQVIPVNRAGSTLILAMSDPSNIFAIDDIKFLTSYNIEVVVASENQISEAIDKYYASSYGFEDVMGEFDEEVDIISEGWKNVFQVSSICRIGLLHPDRTNLPGNQEHGPLISTFGGHGNRI